MFDLSWSFLRLAALFTLGGFLIDTEMIIPVIGFLFLHLNLGLKTIMNDYVHIRKVKLWLIILIRISSLELTRYILELLI